MSEAKLYFTIKLLNKILQELIALKGKILSYYSYFWNSDKK